MKHVSMRQAGLRGLIGVCHAALAWGPSRILGLLVSLAMALAMTATARAHPIDTLQPGQWYRVPNSKLTSVAAQNVPGSFGGIMGAWSGGAFDTTRNRLIIWGGGHGDYAGNEIYAFDVASLTWVRLTDPSTNVGGDANSGYYPDGKPRSFHTYEYIEYVPSIDRFCSFGNSAGYPGVNSTSNIDCFNFSTLQWEPRRGNLPAGAWGTPGTAAAYDSTTGHAFVLGMQSSSIVAEFNPSTNTSTVRSNPSYVGYYVTAEIDPTRRKLVAIGSGQQFMWDISGTGKVNATGLSTSGNTGVVGAPAPGLAYDPVSDRLVAWAGGADVYTLNLDTRVWTRHPPAAGNSVIPTAAAGTGTYGRFRYVPAYNAFIVVNSVSDDVYIYKLTAGAGQPLPPSAPPPVPDTTPPSVSLSAPTSGATISGAAVTISANASDNIGVAYVQFMVNGQNLGAADTATPYSVAWNTTQVANGSYTLSAVARDAAGNQTTSSSITVTVSNQASSPAVPSGSSALLVDFGGTSSGTIFGVTGWTTLLRDRYTDHTNAGPGGTAIVVGDNGTYNFQGVSGPGRSFASGDRVLVTWYNNGAGSVTFTPKVSFDDPNRQVVVSDMPEQGTWHNMTAVTVLAQGTAVSEFIFSSATAGTYAMVNVSSNVTNSGTVICDKIELAAAGSGVTDPGTPPSAADTASPSVPTGLAATALSTTSISASWNAATDNIGVVGYKVYRDGTQVSTTASTTFTHSGLSTGASYSFTVAAYDAVGNTSAQSGVVTQSTQTASPPPPPSSGGGSTNPPPPSSSGPISIPLTLHELLPVGASGVARTNEPATFGIPLKDSNGIRSVGSLGLSGATAYQFHALSTHPSGNLQWVLVDTLGTVPAGGSSQLTLVPGSGNSPGANLAVDNGSTISVTTGPSQFVIKKSGHNIIDSVVTNGTTLVSSGHNGGLQFIDGNGTLFSSAYDNPVVSILENGPVKALVKVEGRFKSASGSNAPVGYTLYLTFHKGLSSVKVGVTLRNGYDAVFARVAFRSFELVLPIALGGTKTFTFPTSKGTYTGTVSGSETAYLYQGYTKSKRGGDDYKWPYLPYLDVPADKSLGGTKVGKDGTVLKDFVGDDTGDYALGWAEAKTASNQGVTVAFKDMDGYFPSGIEFSGDGTVTVGLFSKRNPKTRLVFDWATHESRDILLDFHTAAADNQLINARVQTPLFGRAALEQYRESGAFLGETKIATYAEQQAVYQSNGYKAPSTNAAFSIPNRGREVVRVWESSQGGAENQRDYMLALQLDYVRLGHGGNMLNSLQRAMFTADQFPRHSDDFDFTTKGNSYFDGMDKSAGAPVNGGDWNHHEDDFEHLWVYGLYTSYYFTGDERYAIGAREVAESTFNRFGPSHDKNVFDRLGISGARMAALSYMFSKDQKYLDKVNSYIVYYLNTINQYPGAPLHGRSLTRGYPISPYNESSQVVFSMIVTTYFPPAFIDILRHTPANHVFASSKYPGVTYTKEDLEDVLEGLSYFAIKEAYNFPTSGRPTIAYGYPTLPGGDFSGIRIYDPGYSAAWGYERTGDPEFLTRGARLAVGVDLDQTAISNSEIGLLRLMYDIQHPTETTVGFIPVQVASSGGGSYTLSWTAPANAKRYQLKYATKSIAPNLNYNKNSGSYEFDPAQNIAFWAANNVPGEPTPGSAGTTQTMTVSGLSCGTNCRFALRYSGETTGGSGPSAPPTADTSAPSVPLGIHTTAVGNSQITLAWQPSTDNVGVSGYRVFENGTQISQTTGASYTHANLIPGATYIYAVAAVDGSGNISGLSSPLAVTTTGTPPAPPPPPADTTAPSVPAQPTATVASSTQVNLSWAASTDNVGVVGYKVYRNNTQIATTVSPSYAVTGLTASTTYTFAVSAYDAAGNTSSPSTSVSVTTPSASGGGRQYSVGPADAWCATINNAIPGDTILLKPGAYSTPCWIQAQGTTASPIVVRSENPAMGQRALFNYGGNTSNVIDIGAVYLTLKDLDFGPTQDGVDAIRFRGGHDVVIERNIFTGIGGVSVVSNDTPIQRITVRGNTLKDLKSTGMYFGNHDGTCCYATDLLIEGNLIDGVAPPDSSVGYGLEIKLNSYGTIRDNSVYRTKGPGIMVYGSNRNDPPSIIEGNYVEASRTDGGIVVGGGPAIVRNNVTVGNAYGGVSAQNYNGRNLQQNVWIIHNTVLNNQDAGINVSGWTGGSGNVIAYNAILPLAGTSAIRGSTNATVSGNVTCSSAAACFVQGQTAPYDLWPVNGGVLVDAAGTGSEAWRPVDDFMGVARGGSADVGAFERTGASAEHRVGGGSARPVRTGNGSGGPAPVGDTSAPTVVVTGPVGGASISGAAVVMSATAADNVGVSSVQFQVNGQPAGMADTTAPYTFTWDTTQVGNGTYVLTAVARDMAGNQTTSAAVTVTVANGTAGGGTTSPSLTGALVLVDFGGSPASTTYGPIGWSTLLKDRYTDHRNTGPGGMAIVVGDNGSYNYQGVSGPARTFVAGERIVVAWYNSAATAVTFTPKISFDDPNRQVVVTDMPEQGTWYAMTTVTVPAGGSAWNEYVVTASSAGSHALVNVSSNVTNSGTVICDKIELVAVGSGGLPPSAPPSGVDTAAPTVPGGLSAAAVSSSQINLTWNAASDNVGVSGYRVYRNGTQVGTTSNLSYSATGLTAGTSYSFTVAAYDAAGNVSAQSGAASATTSAAADTAAPTVPGSVTATAISQTQINLAWNASTDNVGVAGYKVYRNGAQVATTAGTSYSSTGLSAGTTYGFTVAAYDAAGNTSGTSASATATTQSPPSPAPAPTTGQVYEINPSNADATCTEEFETTANRLRAGDTLILHGGTYSQACARVLANLHGTEQQPIVIRAAAGERPVVTRPVRPNGDYDQNNMEIDNSSYLKIQGLTFKGGDVGLRLTGTNHHLTIEDSEIAETGNAALTANSGDTDVLIIRHNQIHHTGLFKLGATEGEGLYLGCNNATCRVTNSVIEFNYIHDLRATSNGGNDGIEVKVGSGGNVLRHNVIHTSTVGTAFPCILVYGGGSAPNIVEANAVWQCGEGIAALADAVVRNNVVLQSTMGLVSYPHEQVATLQNVTFVNNTVSGHTECAALRWAGATNMVFANNALYCGGTMALYGTGLTGAGIVVRSNAVEGLLVGGSVDGGRFLSGGSAALAFVSPATMDVWPLTGSPLRGTADAAYLPLSDFNGIPRATSKDVGAYGTKGLSQNPGWRISSGFKVVSGDSQAPAQPKGLRIR